MALIVETREIDPVEDVLAYADPTAPLAWLRRGDGVVAVGAEPVTVLRVPRSAVPEGTPRATLLAAQWRALVASATVDDAVHVPGSGLVAFGALVFDEDSEADSVLIVPRTVLGRHQGRAWITHIRSSASTSTDLTGTVAPYLAPTAYGPHWAGSLGPGEQTPERYVDAVSRAVAEIDAGAYSKVVLARDLRGSLPPGADLRRLVRTLAHAYPDTWTFAVDGLIGASPETLVTVQGGTVTARVLAGTIGRGSDPDTDQAASAHLASSAKDLDEHQYAVQSLLQTLRPHTRALASSEQPFLLTLPNLFHLATDVEGELSEGESALDLVAALHPTAAVAGTPTPVALEAIRRLEPFDRGRYAGPVGWVDAAGNGEWAIALRCAQFEVGTLHDTPPAGIGLTAYAGAGIVAASDPETELLETRVKFRPLVDALA